MPIGEKLLIFFSEFRFFKIQHRGWCKKPSTYRPYVCESWPSPKSHGTAKFTQAMSQKDRSRLKRVLRQSGLIARPKIVCFLVFRCFLVTLLLFFVACLKSS